jgi:hypothetical protein
MRIVRHPNIVELKAFYYSNGDRVCVFLAPIALFVPGFPPFSRSHGLTWSLLCDFTER